MRPFSLGEYHQSKMRARLPRTATEGASSAVTSFWSRVGMLSCPGLFLVLSRLSRDSTSAGEVVMVCKVDVISGEVRIGGVVGGCLRLIVHFAE